MYVKWDEDVAIDAAARQYYDCYDGIFGVRSGRRHHRVTTPWV
jgi:hypothetical protein